MPRGFCGPTSQIFSCVNFFKLSDHFLLIEPHLKTDCSVNDGFRIFFCLKKQFSSLYWCNFKEYVSRRISSLFAFGSYPRWALETLNSVLNDVRNFCNRKGLKKNRSQERVHSFNLVQSDVNLRLWPICSVGCDVHWSETRLVVLPEAFNARRNRPRFLFQ